MSHESGSALLEVIVAVAILAMAGVAAATVTADALRAAHTARAHEADVRAASAFLDAVALWPREDLDLRLGDREQGPWTLRIDRPAPTLFAVSLRDGATDAELLRTQLYRPGPDHDR